MPPRGQMLYSLAIARRRLGDQATATRATKGQSRLRREPKVPGGGGARSTTATPAKMPHPSPPKRAASQASPGSNSRTGSSGSSASNARRAVSRWQTSAEPASLPSSGLASRTAGRPPPPSRGATACLCKPRKGSCCISGAPLRPGPPPRLLLQAEPRLPPSASAEGKRRSASPGSSAACGVSAIGAGDRRELGEG